MGGDFSQCMPPACAARQRFLGFLLFLQAGPLPGLLADSCVQEAAGGDGTVPEHPAAVGIHGEEEGLQGRGQKPVTSRALGTGTSGTQPPGKRGPALTCSELWRSQSISACRTDWAKAWGCGHSREGRKGSHGRIS